MSELPRFFCLGVNYRSCPVAVRERFSVGKSQLGTVNQELLARAALEECVLLSTCNRTELYGWSHDIVSSQRLLLEYFLGSAQLQGSEYFYLHCEQAALYHLARVASGLDSMVIGETEIFGQLKDAYDSAYQSQATGRCANRLFQRCFSIGKKVRHSSRINAGPSSVGAAAVQMAQQHMGELSGKRVLIVGAGAVARSTALSLKSRGAEGVFVANRSYDRALELASQIGGEVIRFSEWIPYLRLIDIIIVSTASPVYVLSKNSLNSLSEQDLNKPRLYMDLSVPRNINPDIASLPHAQLMDVDALETMAQETREKRAAEISQCEDMIKIWVAAQAQDLLLQSRRASS